MGISQGGEFYEGLTPTSNTACRPTTRQLLHVMKSLHDIDPWFVSSRVVEFRRHDKQLFVPVTRPLASGWCQAISPLGKPTSSLFPNRDGSGTSFLSIPLCPQGESQPLASDLSALRVTVLPSYRGLLKASGIDVRNSVHAEHRTEPVSMLSDGEV